MDSFKLQYANGNHPRSPEEQEQIIENAAKAYEAYMDALGFDWRSDPNSADTPRRVAKAFVNDLAEGCYSNPPKITAFDNVDGYDGVVSFESVYHPGNNNFEDGFRKCIGRFKTLFE